MQVNIGQNQDSGSVARNPLSPFDSPHPIILKQMTDILEVLWTHRHFHEPETVKNHRSRRVYRPRGTVRRITRPI